MNVIVLFGIVGELGAGKTLSLTFLLFKNWMFRRKKIFANYHLYGIPYIYISSINQLDNIHDGFVGLDELWLIADSRLSLNKKNRFVAGILSKSRKRILNYTFTAQLLDQLDKRIRKVLDFTAYPIMNTAETLTRVNIFRTGYPREGSYMKTFYFKNAGIFPLYDTNEEIMMDNDDVETVKDPPIYFQESKDSPLEEFETWEEADARAEKFWTKNQWILKTIF